VVDIERLKMYNLLGIDHIQAELVLVGGETLLSEIHNLINYIFVMRKNCLGSGRNNLLYLFTKRALN
jgi:hypothetical protein